jgi:hypothetical protein
MSFNEINSIKSSEQLPQLIRSIEVELSRTPNLSSNDRDRLVHQLDTACNSYSVLQKQALSVGEFAQKLILRNIDGLGDKIRNLYGRIDDRFTDSEVHKIQVEAQTLDAHLHDPKVCENLQGIAKEVHQLKRHINKLCHDYMLRREDQRVILEARYAVRHADAVLRGETYMQPTLIDLPDIGDEMQEEADMQAIGLYEIAHLFYDRKDKQAMKLFHALSDYEKERFTFHLMELSNGGCKKPADDRVKTVEALLTLAHELARSDFGQLSLDDIDAMFKEADTFSQGP